MSSDKKVTPQRVLWGYFPPICNIGLIIKRQNSTEYLQNVNNNST